MPTEKKQLWRSINDSRAAANDFLKSGRRKELKEEGAIDLYRKFDGMSDEEFDQGVANGTITPQQIRKAGEYAFDVYMGDVWSEGDHEGKAEPTYDQFVADPAKYGYVDGGENDAFHFHRYNPNRYKK